MSIFSKKIKRRLALEFFVLTGKITKHFFANFSILPQTSSFSKVFTDAF